MNWLIKLLSFKCEHCEKYRSHWNSVKWFKTCLSCTVEKPTIRIQLCKICLPGEGPFCTRDLEHYRHEDPVIHQKLCEVYQKHVHLEHESIDVI